MVLPAIGQGAQFEGLDAFKDEKGWITVDEATGATSEDGVWAGGDVTNRLGTVTEAIGLGRKAPTPWTITSRRGDSQGISAKGHQVRQHGHELLRRGCPG